jgi:GDP-L-fucose synthase
MNSLVVPALIRRFHEARVNGRNRVDIWGSGAAARDFLFVDDLAQACIFLMEEYQGNDCLNVATGKCCTIAQLAEIIKKEVGYEGQVTYDRSKPEGVSKRVSDVSKINAIGWKYQTELQEGIRATYKDFLAKVENANIRW